MIIKLTTLLSSLLSLSLSPLSFLSCSAHTSHNFQHTPSTSHPTNHHQQPQQQQPTTNRYKKQKQKQEINFYWKKLLMKEPESGIDVKKIFMHRTSFYSFVFCFCCAHFELRITFFCFFLFYYFITATCHKLRK